MTSHRFDVFCDQCKICSTFHFISFVRHEAVPAGAPRAWTQPRLSWCPWTRPRLSWCPWTRTRLSWCLWTRTRLSWCPLYQARVSPCTRTAGADGSPLPGLRPDFRFSVPSILVAVPRALQRNGLLHLLGGAVYKCPLGQVG